MSWWYTETKAVEVGEGRAVGICNYLFKPQYMGGIYRNE